MAKRRAKAETYVRTAQRLARSTPGGVISSGQVAHVAHRRARHAAQMDFYAGDAIRASCLFDRVHQSGGGFGHVELWRIREGAKS